MKQLASIFALILLISACQEPNPAKPPEQNLENVIVDSLPRIASESAAPEKPVSELAEGEISWSDALLKRYMAFANTEVLKQAHKNNFTLEWEYDNTLKTDSAVFDVYRIGHEISRDEGADTRFIVDQWVYLDTLRKELYEYDAAANKINKWWASDKKKAFFYPVYELSPKTTAFVINAWEQGAPRGFMDTLFDKFYPKKSSADVYACKSCVPKKWKLFDTSGIYKLIKSDALEKEARRYIDSAFYVYGTNGYTRSGIKSIAIGLDECRTNIFAFCLDNDSLKSIGHPVFCSTRLIPLHYGSNYKEVEKGLDSYFASQKADYSDSMKTKIIGNLGDFYFGYHDDFIWGRNFDQSKCRFPGRAVWLVEKKNYLGGFWNEDLDLFGTECD
jgi:hypothetical protein